MGLQTDRVASHKDALNVARRYMGHLEIYRNVAARLTGPEEDEWLDLGFQQDDSGGACQ